MCITKTAAYIFEYSKTWTCIKANYDQMHEKQQQANFQKQTLKFVLLDSLEVQPLTSYTLLNQCHLVASGNFLLKNKKQKTRVSYEQLPKFINTGLKGIFAESSEKKCQRGFNF